MELKKINIHNKINIIKKYNKYNCGNVAYVVS